MTADDFSSPRRSARSLALAASVLVVAAWVRWIDLAWGLPWIEEEALPVKKAFEMWGWAEGSLRLDPQTAGWPSLSFHTQLLLQHLQYAIGRLTGEFQGPLDYFVAYQVDPTRTMLWARSLSVVAALVVVAVAMRIAFRLTRHRGAWALGGMTLALSPLFIAQSQMASPDILLTLFAALAVDRILCVGRDGRPRDYVLAGIFAGLGTAAKYTPILLCLSLYLVHLRRRRVEGRSLRWAGVDDARLGWAALATLLAFCLASPYTFADLEVLRRDFAYQMLHMQRGHFGHTAQGPGYLYYLQSVLAPGMGWPLVLSGGVGLGWMAWRHRGPWLDLLHCTWPLAVVLGSLSTRFDRYMLPLLLPLALAAAGLFWSLSIDLAGRIGARARAGVWILALLACVPAAQGAWRHHTRISSPSTQTLAAQWLEGRGGDFVFASEHYGPHLRNDDRAELRASPVFERLSQAQRQTLLDRPYLEHLLMPLYSTRVELGAFYYDLRFLLAEKYVVTSGAVRKRYEADPGHYPRQNAFYRDLDHYAELVARFEPSEQVRGPELRIYRITESTRQSLEQDRGKLEPGFAEAWYSRVHRPHFLGFLEGVASHALRGESFAQAALFYEALLEVAPAADRNFVVERLGYAKLRGEDLEGAAISYASLVNDPEYRAVACANLGFIRERQGQPEAAREFYRQSLEAGGDASVRTWIQNRMRLLGP